ncbi:MAG: tRNA uracil 4-sulfurtransferase ThiI [Mycoplasmatota bacterium]
MDKLILIKYGELTTKKANRKQFINLLNSNIKKILKNHEINIKQDRVRMYIEVLDGKFEQVVEKLQKVFGIHGIVICHKVEKNEETIKSKVKEILTDIEFKTFKVKTNRADKQFLIKSDDFNRIIGGFVLDNFDCKVDVHNPDIYVYIEIRQDNTYIYTNEIRGIGGYPVGVQGKGLLMLSGGIDSPVAGYLALKRGVNVECLYFESPPHTSVDAKNKVIKLASLINEYSGNIKVHIVPFTKIQEAIYKNCKQDYMITIMRRMMYKIAEKYAKRNKFKIIINGESIGQVASQTLSSMSVINEVTNMPIIRPVACLDKLEIIELAKKINTYETSILPFEDCCTIFLPKHPVINPTLNVCLEEEKNVDFDLLIEECINNIKVEKLEKEEFLDLL